MSGTISPDMVTAAVAGFSPAQVQKALALIAEDRIQPTQFPGEFIVVSSDGVTHYLTTRDACQCPGAMRRNGLAKCKHQCSVRLYEAGSAL